MHYHNRIYKAISIGDDCPQLIGTTMATILTVAGLAATAIATTVSSRYSAAQEKKLQEKAFEYQEGQVAVAEAKVAVAEKLAAEQAVTTLKRKRAAYTNTILTSPLGLVSEANVGMTRLLGG